MNQKRHLVYDSNSERRKIRFVKNNNQMSLCYLAVIKSQTEVCVLFFFVFNFSISLLVYLYLYLIMQNLYFLIFSKLQIINFYFKKSLNFQLTVHLSGNLTSSLLQVSKVGKTDSEVVEHKYPVELGTVTSWNDMEKVKPNFYEEIRVKYENQRILNPLFLEENKNN